MRLKRCVFAGVVVCLVACTTDMPSFDKGDPAGGKRVVIAAEDSKFKRAVVNAVIDTLGTDEYYFRVLGLSCLDTAAIGDHGAILLVCKLTGGTVESAARRFLRKKPQNPRAVLFLTLGMDGPLPDSARAVIDVDAVTSASRNERVGELAGQLAALIRSRF